MRPKNPPSAPPNIPARLLLEELDELPLTPPDDWEAPFPDMVVLGEPEITEGE